MPFVPELLLQETALIGRALGGNALAREIFSSPTTVKAVQNVERIASMPSQASPAAKHSLDQIEQLYRSAPIEFAKRRGDWFNSAGIRTGVIEGGNTFEHVMVREITTPLMATRQNKELAVYAIHKESPFTTHFPITVARHNENLLVQQRTGRSLNDAMSLIDKRFYRHLPPPMPPPVTRTLDAGNYVPYWKQDSAMLEWKSTVVEWNRAMVKYRDSSPGFRDLLHRSAVFRDQMEQSVAERLVLGDWDGHKGNFTLLIRNGRFKIANVDMEAAFSNKAIPPTPRIREFIDAPVSASTLTKIGAFNKKFDSSWGRSFLGELGLDEAQIAAMLSRSKWLLKDGHFPI